MALGTLIGLAMLAAGTGTQMAAASRARKAMNREVVRHLEQQERFRQEAVPLFESSLAASSPEAVAAQMMAGSRDVEDVQQRPSLSSMDVARSILPVDEQRLSGQVGQQRRTASGLQGLAEFALQQQLKNQTLADRLGVVQNLSRTSAASLPALSQLAGQESANLAGIGSLLSTAGSLTAIYKNLFPGTAPLNPKAPLVNPPLLDAPAGFGSSFRGQA